MQPQATGAALFASCRDWSDLELAANAALWAPGAVCWTRDIKSAYLVSVLGGGCTPGLHCKPEHPDGSQVMKTPGLRRRWVGCLPA
eukprot:1187068-Rhodomonas_salina.1